MARKTTDKEGKDDASSEQLKLMYEKQNEVLKNIVRNNKALVAFVNGFRQRFDKFRTAHSEFLASSSAKEGSTSARSSQSVNEDRPSSAHIIRRRIIRVDDNASERSTSRS